MLMIECAKQAAYLWLKEHPSSGNALKIATGSSISLTSGDLLAFFRDRTSSRINSLCTFHITLFEFSKP